MTDAGLDPRVARTRQVVLAAAAEALVVDGFERVTIDAIAERSGVARSTIYRNWPSKAGLLVEAFGTLVVKPDVAGSDLAEVLGRYGRWFADGIASEPWGRALPSLVGAAAYDAELGTALRAFSRARRAEMVGVVARSLGRPAAQPGPDLAPSMFRFVGAFFFAGLVAGEPLDDEFVACQVQLTLDELARA